MNNKMMVKMKEIQNRLGLMYIVSLALGIFIVVTTITSAEKIDKIKTEYEQELSNIKMELNLSKTNEMLLINQSSSIVSENEYLKLKNKTINNEIEWSREQLSLRSIDKTCNFMSDT